MKKYLKVSFWTIAVIVMVIVGVSGFSYVYFHYDAHEIEKERVSDLPPYYRSIAGNYCAQVFPGTKTGMWRDCCIASLRDMAFDSGVIAPFALTSSPTRGCEAGTYVRKRCSGSLEWCETVSSDSPMITMESVSYLEKDSGKTERDKRILALLADANMEADFMTGIRIEEDLDERVRGKAFFKYDWNKNADFTAVRTSEGDWVIEQPLKTDEIESVRDLINEEYVFTPIDTSDWKTYRNEKQGYEVQYPTSWTIKDDQKNGITLNSKENEELLKKIQLGKMYGEGYMSDINIVYYESILEEPENILNELNARTIDEFVERNYVITKIEKIKFLGETAWVVKWGGFGAYLTVLVEHNNHLYKIMFGNKEKISDLSVIDYEILRSFSFLN